ncbi:alginate lyase family protein [Pontiellaceae bacterium B12219]|nr:alginate lyase family protein [Pontiellaceae bacterium B12219]
MMKSTTSMLIALISGFVATSANALVHPGGWHTQADLTLIRTKVAAGEEPWVSGWNAIKNTDADEYYTATVSSPMTDKSALSDQGHAAYVLAIKWVATGEQKYATAAINIIDAWVNTVEEFDVWGPTLTLSTAGGHMAQAAEILAHGFNGEAGWPAERIAKAKIWFKEVVYPFTSTGGMRTMNWGTSCVGGNMSMAVFCDDQTMFEDACDAYKYGFTDTDDGACGVAQYIINDEGQCYESGRDQVHTQGGIAHLLENALCAWNQGVDLVSFSNYRIVAGMEYTAKYNLGYDVPWTSNIPNPTGSRHYWPDGISADGRGRWSPIYYMSAKLFTLAGVPHPYTAEVVASPGYAPEFTNTSHPGMGTMCFIVEELENVLKELCDGNVIPGTIEAEHYTYSETDGQGKTYHDTTKGNRNGAYRTDDVDIVALPDGGFALTEMVEGEWLTYTVSVPEAGNYDVAVRYAAREEGAIQIGFKDGASTASTFLPVTENSSWAMHVVGRNLPLNQGEQQMKLKVTEGKAAYILDHVSIQPTEED